MARRSVLYKETETQGLTKIWKLQTKQGSAVRILSMIMHSHSTPSLRLQSTNNIVPIKSIICLSILPSHQSLFKETPLEIDGTSYTTIVQSMASECPGTLSSVGKSSTCNASFSGRAPCHLPEPDKSASIANPTPTDVPSFAAICQKGDDIGKLLPFSMDLRIKFMYPVCLCPNQEDLCSLKL